MERCKSNAPSAVTAGAATGEGGAEEHGETAEKRRNPREDLPQSAEISRLEAGRSRNRRIGEGKRREPVNSKANRVVRVGIDGFDIRITGQAAIDAMKVKERIRIAVGGVPFVAFERQAPEQCE